MTTIYIFTEREKQLLRKFDNENEREYSTVVLRVKDKNQLENIIKPYMNELRELIQNGLISSLIENVDRYAFHSLNEYRLTVKGIQAKDKLLYSTSETIVHL